MKTILVTFRDLFPLLPAGARRFLVRYISATSVITLLDVAATGLFALLIYPAIDGSNISLPLIGELPASASPIVVLVACFLMVLKSGLSVMLNWIATRRFARYEHEIGQRMFRAYIHSSWEERSKRSVAEITRIADMGIANTIMGFLLPLSRIPNLALSFVMILGVVLVADPLTCIIALVY